MTNAVNLDEAASDLLTAYKLLYSWLDTEPLDYPTAVLLSRLSTHVSSAYLAMTGQTVGVGLGWA